MNNYRCINNTSDYTVNGLDKGFALIGVTIIRSNNWWHPMLMFFLLCCLPFRKADDTASPALSRPCGRRLQLRPLCLGPAVSSTFAMIGFIRFIWYFKSREAYIIGFIGSICVIGLAVYIP
jgi:hypothetical protein